MSIIRAIKHRLGLSVTPANNFVWDASADNGTMKLARESGQDIMTVDAAGKVAFPQNVEPIFAGSLATSGIGSNYTPLLLDALVNVGVAGPGAGQVYTPNRAGWYQCDLSMTVTCIGANVLGCGIIGTNGAAYQIQQAYGGAYAFASCSVLLYFNGINNTVSFNVHADIAGGTVSNVRGSLHWVHP